MTKESQRREDTALQVVEPLERHAARPHVSDTCPFRDVSVAVLVDELHFRGIQANHVDMPSSLGREARQFLPP